MGGPQAAIRFYTKNLKPWNWLGVKHSSQNLIYICSKAIVLPFVEIVFWIYISICKIDVIVSKMLSVFIDVDITWELSSVNDG